MPVSDRLILPEAQEDSKPSWFGFLLSVRPESGLCRNQITKYIENCNVQTRLLLSGNLIRQPAFDGIRGTKACRIAGNLKNTDFVMNNSFWVGVYPGMDNAMADDMAEIITKAVR